MRCNKGNIQPLPIHCETGMRKSRGEILTEALAAESKEEEDDNNIDLPHLTDTSDMDEGSNSTDDHNTTEELKMCGPPSISDGALVYK